MIKLVAGTDEGGYLVGLGLTDENLRRLRLGQPITVKLGEMLPQCDGVEIVIFAGRDELEMTQQLAGLIGPDTKIRVDPPDQPDT